MARILITGAGGPAGSSLGAQLAGSGHHVVGADMTTPEAAVAAHFAQVVTVPRADSPAFLPAIRALIAAQRLDLVIPTVQEELPLFAGADGLLGAPVAIGSAQSVWRAQDKLTTMWALADAGVSVPTFLALDDAGEPGPHGPAGWTGGFPLVVKPRTSRGGRGVQVLDTPQEWTQQVGALPGHIVQGFADGTEYAVQLYVPASGPATSIVLEKTALKEGRVGNAAGVRRVEEGAQLDVAQIAIDAAHALGLRGPLDMDIRRDPLGVPLVLEINARFGANSAHAPELLEAVLRDYLPASATAPQAHGQQQEQGQPQPQPQPQPRERSSSQVAA